MWAGSVCCRRDRSDEDENEYPWGCNDLVYECSTFCSSDDQFDLSDAENIRITFDLRHAELQYPPDPEECPFGIGLAWIEGGEFHECGYCYDANGQWTHLEMLCPEACGGSEAYIYL